MQNQQRRGWISFGAGVFLMALVAGIWVWIDLLLAGGARQNPAEATFLGKLNVAFALIFIAAVLGTINGWRMAKSGRRSIALIFAMVVAFIAGFIVAFGASNGFQTP
jgi:predicted hotdog family 3-hydroxylacyl-ACP dehydratase